MLVEYSTPRASSKGLINEEEGPKLQTEDDEEVEPN
jgi:hypothetical protein